MKYIIQIILLFFYCLSSFAQEKISYNDKKNNIEFQVSLNEFYIEYDSQDTIKLKSFKKGEIRKIRSNASIIKLDNLMGDNADKEKLIVKELMFSPNEIEPVLIFKDGIKQIATNELFVKVKSGVNINDLLKSRGFEIKPLSLASNLFIISLNTISTRLLFQLVNDLQKDNRIEFAEPNFIRELKPLSNDPFYSSQWAIKNQGYQGGVVGADMRVEQAWNYATGTNIKVAIIDEGVDLNHPDLISNMLTGYDATGNNSNGAPNYLTNDAHGTACAGIVAAVANNNIGIAGVAYNSKIIPIRIAYSNGYPLNDIRRKWITQDSWIANGINWAWQNGADVLSNSWSGGSYSNTIATAINNAVNNGRNGKGSIVLFATGNDNSSVKFPATLTNVIAVGASSMCDERKTPLSCDGEGWGSNYGNGLDIIAPGVKIYTTDNSGNSGYNSSNYKSDFNGTSSATPNAAGVVALILSVNPNLTGQQLRNILEGTCDKVGGYNYQLGVSGQPNGSWSNQAGYGRVNATAAVCMATNQLMAISGPATLCNSQSYSINTNQPVSWSVSPTGIVNLNPSGNQVTLTRVYDGPFTLSATINNSCNVSISRQLLSGATPIPSTEIIGGIPDNYQFCVGSSFNVYSTISPVQVSNNWSVIGGTITSGQGTPFVNIQLDNTPGGYAIMLPYTDACGEQRIAQLQGQKVDNGCSGSNTQTSTSVKSISIFPNPTNDIVNISLPSTSRLSETLIIITDFYGKTISKLIPTSNLSTVSLSQFDKGIYFLHILEDGKKLALEKIIKN